MLYTVYIMPVFILLMIVYAAIKKVRVYNSFVDGSKEALELIIKIFPYIAAIFICMQLLKVSGLSGTISKITAKPLEFFGIPAELSELLILRPLSGNGTLAVLEGIFEEYGADSYISKCAAAVAGSSETIFYVAAIYFSDCEVKKLKWAIPISLLASFLGAVVACMLCRFF